MSDEKTAVQESAENIEPSELEYLTQCIEQRRDGVPQLQEKIDQLGREIQSIIGAYQNYSRFLMTKYGMTPNDYISPDGTINRANTESNGEAAEA